MKNTGSRMLSLLQIVYVLCCILANVCFAIFRYSGNDIFFALGDIFTPVWIVVGMVTVVCLPIAFFRKNISLGKKSIFYVLLLVFDIALFIISGALLVALTGGV